LKGDSEVHENIEIREGRKKKTQMEIFKLLEKSTSFEQKEKREA
jgi:hypothetical protein